MPRRGKRSIPSYGRSLPIGAAFTVHPLPTGVPRPMCFCGTPCKVQFSDEDETYKQRYWMCDNFQWEPTPLQRRSNWLTPPPICDFEEWIDTEVKESDKKKLQDEKDWEAEIQERHERRMKEEAAEKEHKKEEEMRRAAAYMDDVEKKEENPDA